VSEAGRQLIASMLAQLTHQQLVDLFTVARVDLFAGDSIASWVAAFEAKMARDIFNTRCPATP